MESYCWWRLLTLPSTVYVAAEIRPGNVSLIFNCQVLGSLCPLQPLIHVAGQQQVEWSGTQGSLLLL